MGETTSTEGHIQTVLSMVSAFQDGRLEDLQRFVSPSVVVQVKGNNPYAGTYEGVGAAMAFVARARQWIDPESVSIQAIEREEAPVVSVSALAVGPGGQRTDTHLIVEYFFEGDGRVGRAVVRAQDQRALDRVLRGWSAGS
ncbi:MAG: nuclear transport factor 2 family protein [Actinomycetota bacterium]|nr:nuclear transport factor 2 family protein [Actinomycetota bacterium]